MENSKKKIMYIQHARTYGGSVVSLLYTVKALDRNRYIPVIALVFPHKLLVDFYSNHDIEVVDASGLALFHHTTARWARFSRPRTFLEFFKDIFLWKNVTSILNRLKKAHKVDIFHLNSVVLAPVARVLLKNNIAPYVWHVRESPVKGYIGLRFRFVRNLLQRSGSRVVFLSNADQNAWVSGKCGTVVNNFIDLRNFDLQKSKKIPNSIVNFINGDPIILFLGGFSKIKGTLVLLEALALLKNRGCKFQCIFAGTIDIMPRNTSRFRMFIKIVIRFLGWKSFHDQCIEFMSVTGLRSRICMLPFVNEIPQLLAVGSCLVFPSTEPHFARPVIEAQAMGLPVVASDIEGVSELIVDPLAASLIRPEDPHRLSEAIAKVLQNPPLKEGKKLVVKKARIAFGAEQKIKKIEVIYERLLS